MKRKLLASIGALLFLGSATSVSMAGSMTANMNVSIKIVSGCSVSGQDMNFGGWANLNSPRYATSNVKVTCNVDPGSTGSNPIAEKYHVSLSAGKSGNMTAREMRDPSNNAIKYNIYLRPNYTGTFGDGTNGTELIEGTVSHTADDSYTVYGKTEIAATAPASGDYVDNLTLTVAF